MALIGLARFGRNLDASKSRPRRFGCDLDASKSRPSGAQIATASVWMRLGRVQVASKSRPI
eukprot:9164306-Pyramimonas_sp.AAC.1